MDDEQAVLELRFGHSTSQNYKKALRLARKLPGFEEAEDKAEHHRVALAFDQIASLAKRFESLVDLVGSWRSSEILHRGEPCSLEEYRAVISVARCHEGLTASVWPDQYCRDSNGRPSWGCQFLDVVSLGTPDHSWELVRTRDWWFQFGSFRDEATWVVDKAAIRSVLERQASARDLAVCPAFNLEGIDEVLGNLPDLIGLGEGSDWEVEFEEAYVGGQIEKQPVRVRPKLKEDDLGSGLSIGILGAGRDSGEEGDPKPQRNIPEVSFDDVGGVDDIIDQIREVIELPLIHPELFAHFGISPHHGILLYGPPGCGKTLIAKAIANEVEAHFISVRGPELLSKYYGESEENLRAVFSEARGYEPSIIFFDEIDSIAQTRSGSETNRLEDRLVNQLLTLMDGFQDMGRVCVIASTNRPELIDAAVKRPGRFDYMLEVSMPGPEGVARIFEIHTRDMPVDGQFQVREFSQQLVGLSGADIAFVAREGALNCIRKNLEIASVVHDKGAVDLELGDLQVSEVDFQRALGQVLQSKGKR